MLTYSASYALLEASFTSNYCTFECVSGWFIVERRHVSLIKPNLRSQTGNEEFCLFGLLNSNATFFSLTQCASTWVVFQLQGFYFKSLLYLDKSHCSLVSIIDSEKDLKPYVQNFLDLKAESV